MQAHQINTDVTFTPHQLSSSDTELIHQAAVWAEEQWGFVLKFAGLTNRKRLIKALTVAPNAFYVFTCNGKPVGMFALRPCVTRELCPELKHLTSILEIDYVYTDASLRGLGLGSQIVEFALSEARKAGAKYLALDTLDKALNAFYLRLGAKYICDSHYHGLPTSKLMFTL